MTNIKRAPAVRLLALLLAVVMLGGLFAMSAQAATMANVKQYHHYVCIGDSIAAGYGSYARDARGFVTVPEAYHSHVANATGATVQSLAHTGMRTVEVRWLLDDAYSASKEASDLRAMYFNGLHDILNWMEMTKKNPNDPLLARYADPDSEYYIRPGTREALAPYCSAGAFGFKNFFRQNIGKADLCTVALGLNDIFLYAMKQTAAQLDDPGMNLVKEVAEFLKYMTIGETAFKNNWAPLINAIKSYNKNIDIVVVGMYNPFGKVKAFTQAELVPVGRAADLMVARLNSYMKSQASVLGYKYADVTATEIDDTVPFIDPTFFDEIVKDCHPTEAGHKYIAEQIVAQLPERGGADPTPVNPTPTGLPFTDVAASDWFYNDVKYCYDNGLMTGMGNNRFEPYGTTTRAQFATVLYRMAGSPNVGGMSCPFSDVPANSWYRSAVIWAFNNGIVKGTSETTFTPDASITREQMVSMLYRYSGSKEVTGNLNMFSDKDRVSDYAVPAVIWAVQNKIVSGMGNGTFYPQGYATRGQLAKVLHAYKTM